MPGRGGWQEAQPPTNNNYVSKRVVAIFRTKAHIRNRFTALNRIRHINSKRSVQPQPLVVYLQCFYLWSFNAVLLVSQVGGGSRSNWIAG